MERIPSKRLIIGNGRSNDRNTMIEFDVGEANMPAIGYRQYATGLSVRDTEGNYTDIGGAYEAPIVEYISDGFGKWMSDFPKGSLIHLDLDSGFSTNLLFDSDGWFGAIKIINAGPFDYATLTMTGGVSFEGALDQLRGEGNVFEIYYDEPATTYRLRNKYIPKIQGDGVNYYASYSGLHGFQSTDPETTVFYSLAGDIESFFQASPNGIRAGRRFTIGVEGATNYHVKISTSNGQVIGRIGYTGSITIEALKDEPENSADWFIVNPFHRLDSEQVYGALGTYQLNSWSPHTVQFESQGDALDVNLPYLGVKRGHRQKILVTNGGSFYPLRLMVGGVDVIETIAVWGYIEVEALVDQPSDPAGWQIIDSYEEGFHQTTFKFNGTSGGTSSNQYINFIRRVKQVTLQFSPDIKATTGTTSTAFVSQTALPERLRPNYGSCAFGVGIFQTNALQQWPGVFNVGTDGHMTISKDFINTAWGNSAANSGFDATQFTFLCQY